MRKHRVWGLCVVMAVLLLAATAFACGQENKQMKTVTSPLTGKVYAVLEGSDGKVVLQDITDQDMKKVSKDAWGIVTLSGSVDKAAGAYKNALNPDVDFKMDFSEPKDRAATKETFTTGNGSGQAAPAGN